MLSTTTQYIHVRSTHIETSWAAPEGLAPPPEWQADHDLGLEAAPPTVEDHGEQTQQRIVDELESEWSAPAGRPSQPDAWTAKENRPRLGTPQR